MNEKELTLNLFDMAYIRVGLQYIVNDPTRSDDTRERAALLWHRLKDIDSATLAPEV